MRAGLIDLRRIDRIGRGRIWLSQKSATGSRSSKFSTRILALQGPGPETVALRYDDMHATRRAWPPRIIHP
ncbi:hypothetical protein MA20_20030 [Bradyrhizobium japonicum]|uniref:Uncharacterized protein n=1 Tax=Bradyrhizobium japonicum TaxID=375 RepID=A0A0A3XUG8_BRAJP|nr:hypothetical protein MA20_20030 [Bradyrhizobium japonicum]